MIRIGQGLDVHAFDKERKLILAGIEVPHHQGLIGHSDADVLTHAVIDAILGACSLGDIGKIFPDNDMVYKDADSILLLKMVLMLVPKFKLQNLDVTVMAEKPKLLPYIKQMRENLANAFKCELSQISIKATTTEKLGFVGREEGICAMAVVLIDLLEKIEI